MARKPIEEARREVAVAAARIADLQGLRSKVYERNSALQSLASRGISFGTLSSINRRRNLAPFGEYLADVSLEALGGSEAGDAVARSLATEVARSVGRPDITSVDVPGEIDPRFLNVQDGTDVLFRDVIFRDKESSDRWMRELDKVVTASSAENIRKIDFLDTQDEVAQFDAVIVGGGPLTAVAASLLGPGRRVTVVTQDRSIGYPWRSRPLYINSSPDDDLIGPRIPLLSGTTTPINGSQVGLLGTDILARAGQDVKQIVCDDRSVRKYVSGLELGKLVATNIALQADDYLVNQTVDIASSTQVMGADGKTRTRLVLREGNATRIIEANTVLVLSGPGQETLKGITNDQSKNLYDTSTSIFRENFLAARKRVSVLSEQLRQIRTDKFVPSDEKVSREAELKSTIRAEASTIVLPRVLTLSIVENLIDFWITDLERDPEAFPLAPLLQNDVRIGNIGGKDTSRTIIELLKGQGPKGAYPAGFDTVSLEQDGGPKFVLYNEKARTPEELIATLRKRYQDLALFAETDQVRINPNKVASFGLVNNQGQLGITITDEKGNTDIVDYAFVATGFERPRYEEQLADRFSFDIVKDLEGENTIRGDDSADFYIGGSASGLKKQDFPNAIREIIDILGIPENTISLWVNVLLLERFLLSYISGDDNGINQAKVAELLSSDFVREFVPGARRIAS